MFVSDSDRELGVNKISPSCNINKTCPQSYRAKSDAALMHISSPPPNHCAQWCEIISEGVLFFTSMVFSSAVVHGIR